MNELSIAIIEPVGGYGGMDYYDYGLAMGLGANNVEVLLFTSYETKLRSYPKVTTFLCFKKMWKRSFFIKVYKYLMGHFLAINQAKKVGVKIFHLHFFAFRSIDLIILWYIRLRNLKVIVTIHDINSFDKEANSIIEKKCFNYMNGIIVHNQSSLDVLNKKNDLLIPKRIIPHGNYLPFIDVISDNVKLESRVFTLLFFGQIKDVKGLDILLEAINLVKKNGFKVELIIAGKAWKSDLNKYKKLIVDLDIDKIVKTYFRYIPDEEVKEFYKKADLVVLPYRRIYQSGVLLLTLSYGKPVLCSDLEPFKEIIIDNQNGFLFESENSTDLASRIQNIILNKKDLSRVIHNSDKMIRDNFDWINIGSLTKDFYQFVDQKND